MTTQKADNVFFVFVLLHINTRDLVKFYVRQEHYSRCLGQVADFPGLPRHRAGDGPETVKDASPYASVVPSSGSVASYEVTCGGMQTDFYHAM